MGHHRHAELAAMPGQVARELPDHWRIDELEIMLTSIDKDKAKTNPSSVFDKPADVVSHTELQPAEKAAILQEWELEARLTDVAIDEGMTGKGEDGSNKVAVKSLLPEVKKAQQDLGAKPIPDEGAPTRFTP
jgi:hypothetical protein